MKTTHTPTGLRASIAFVSLVALVHIVGLVNALVVSLTR